MAAAGFPKTATINQDVGLPPPRSPSEMPFVNEEWRNDKWAMLEDKFHDQERAHLLLLRAHSRQHAWCDWEISWEDEMRWLTFRLESDERSHVLTTAPTNSDRFTQNTISSWIRFQGTSSSSLHLFNSLFLIWIPEFLWPRGRAQNTWRAQWTGSQYCPDASEASSTPHAPRIWAALRRDLFAWRLCNTHARGLLRGGDLGVDICRSFAPEQTKTRSVVFLWMLLSEERPSITSLAHGWAKSAHGPSCRSDCLRETATLSEIVSVWSFIGSQMFTVLQKCCECLWSQWKVRRGSKQGKVRHDTWMAIFVRTQRCAILEPRVFAWWNVIMLCATLYVLYLWVYCSHPLSVGWRFFSRQPKPVLTVRKITTCQDLKSAENSICLSSTGFGPRWRRWRSCLQVGPRAWQMSAGFPATVCRISNLCSGQRRSQGLRGLQIVGLFAVLFVDCDEYLCILVGFLPGACHAIAFSFRLSKVGSLIEWLLSSSFWICCKNPLFEFFQLS